MSHFLLGVTLILVLWTRSSAFTSTGNGALHPNLIGGPHSGIYAQEFRGRFGWWPQLRAKEDGKPRQGSRGLVWRGRNQREAGDRVSRGEDEGIMDLDYAAIDDGLPKQSRGQRNGSRYKRLSGYSKTLTRSGEFPANLVSGTVQRSFMRSTSSLAARLNIGTLLRVALPSLLAAVLGYAYFDNISLFLYNNWLSAGEIQFLSSDEVQFIPSFLQVLGLLFSILAGNAYSVLYEQQETIYFALFQVCVCPCPCLGLR
jgi:hypothetical protein